MSTNPPTLHVRHMRVIWRDTFIVENAAPRFLDDSRARLRDLPCYVADARTEPLDKQPEMLRIVERVSKAVAGVGYPDLLRCQFAPFEVASLRPALGRYHTAPQRLRADQIIEAGLEADGAGAPCQSSWRWRAMSMCCCSSGRWTKKRRAKPR